MNSHSEMLAGYQTLVNLSHAMLTLASAGEWDSLIAHEVEYLQAVERVTQNSVSRALPPALQTAIRRHLSQVLANESQLKAILYGRMDRLRVMVNSSNHQRSINNTYGKISGNILFPEEI